MAGNAGADVMGIYEPLMPPFHALTDTNRGPIAIVTSIPLIIIATLTVMVKLWTVYGTTRTLGLNDAAVIASAAFGIGYTVCIGQAVNSGLGTIAEELDESMMEALSKYYFASNILLVLAITCAKATVLLFIITLKPQRTVVYVSYCVLGLSILWGVASVVALSCQCSPTRWALGPSANNECVDQRTMQIVIRSIDVLTDVAIVLLPAFMMQKVQTSRKKKLMVTGLFGIRICTPVATVVSIVSLSKYYNARLADRSFAAITPSIWTSLALSFSIITACIPSIKRFLTDWAAGISRAAVIDTFELQHTTGRSHSENKSYTQGTGRNNQLTSKLGLNRSGRSEVTSTCRSHGDREDSGIPVQTRKWQRSRSDDTGDSVKGLTDGMIMHTMDYTVEYEDPDVASLDHNGNTNSGREGAVFKC